MDDGDPPSDQPIEECGLAHIGASDDCYLESHADNNPMLSIRAMKSPAKLGDEIAVNDRR
jgi:hypothetical protein